VDYRRIWKIVWVPISSIVALIGLAKALSWPPVKDRLGPLGDWVTASSLRLPHYGWIILALAVVVAITFLAFDGLVRRPGRIRVGDRVRIPWALGEMEGTTTRIWGPPGRRQISIEIALPDGGTTIAHYAVDEIRLAPPRLRFRKPRLGPDLDPPF